MGAAGKRQPTTYIISNEGEIGVRRRVDSPKSVEPAAQSHIDKRFFAHERTLSRFGSYVNDSSDLHQKMPPITKNTVTRQASLVDKRQRTAQSETYRVKNKYGMTIRGCPD